LNPHWVSVASGTIWRASARNVAGSTFSVQRHSAAVFRDVAAIWLRSRAEPGREQDLQPREALDREPATAAPQQPLPAGASTI
jgi:hypothetical protein